MDQQSSRYDSHTTTFSPEGRLFQVEYAMEDISHAGAAVGILSSKEGIVLAAEKKLAAKLLDTTPYAEKMSKVDDHVTAVVAGITSDANILIDFLRRVAQRHLVTYGEPIPVEQLVQRVCDQKQSYTQSGGLRPFGVSFLYAGWDAHRGFQLYQSDPSGNYYGWHATAIGANNQSATALLKTDYKDDMSLHDMLVLAMRVIAKTMDTTSLDPKKVEAGCLVLNKTTHKPEWRALTEAELAKLISMLPDTSAADTH